MINQTHLLSSVTELMEKACTMLPDDVHAALTGIREGTGSSVAVAPGNDPSGAAALPGAGLPICRDTGVPLVIVRTVPGPVMFAVESAVGRPYGGSRKGISGRTADPLTAGTR